MSRHTSSWDALRLILPSVFWPELFPQTLVARSLPTAPGSNPRVLANQTVPKSHPRYGARLTLTADG